MNNKNKWLNKDKKKNIKQKFKLVLTMFLILTPFLVFQIYKGISAEKYNKELESQERLIQEIVNSGDLVRCLELTTEQDMREKCFIMVGINTNNSAVCEFASNKLCELIVTKNISGCEKACEVFSGKEGCETDYLIRDSCKTIIDDWQRGYP